MIFISSADRCRLLLLPFSLAELWRASIWCTFDVLLCPQFVHDTGTRVRFQTQHRRVLALPWKVPTVSSSVPRSDAIIATRSAANSSIWELSALFTTEYLQITTRQNKHFALQTLLPQTYLGFYPHIISLANICVLATSTYSHIVVSTKCSQGLSIAFRCCPSPCWWKDLPLNSQQLHNPAPVGSISSNIAVDWKGIKGWCGCVSGTNIKCHSRRPSLLTSMSRYTAEETVALSRNSKEFGF